jgi:DNA gyrase subunit B
MKDMYGPESIEVLDMIDAVRRRPAMYIGDTRDGSGLRHLVWEVIANVIDEHVARCATELHVEIADSWVTVRDDGRGIPVDPVGRDGRSALETIFTTIHCGPTRDGHFPHLHLTLDLRGVGLAPVNALCARLEVETTRDGVRWAQAYERGRPVSDVRRLGPSARDGTCVRFRPDQAIFGETGLDIEALGRRLQELAWLNPLLRVFFQERRLYGRRGVAGWLAAGIDEHGGTPALYATCQQHDNVLVDLALGWRDGNEARIRSFVNMSETMCGTHVNGLWEGLTTWLAKLGVANASAATVRAALAPGLVAILHVGLYAPEFGGPTRTQLESPAAGAAVRSALARDAEWVARNAPLRDHLLARLTRTSPAE